MNRNIYSVDMLIKHRISRPIKQESLSIWLLESWQGGSFPPCCALGLNCRNYQIIGKMRFLGFQGYCNTVRKMQDLATMGEKTGYFSVQFAFSKHAQKPRKWLKTVLFSTFGLLESLKKAVKKRFKTSLNNYFANSWNCTVFCIGRMHKGCWYCCLRSADVPMILACRNPLNRLRLQRSIAIVWVSSAGIVRNS